MQNEKNTNTSTFPDTNNNGVPDYKETWLYKLGLAILLREIRKHPHTLVARALAAIEKVTGEIAGQK